MRTQFNNHELEKIVDQLVQEGNVSAKEILQTVLNLLMQSERNLHVSQYQNDKGNGYFERSLGTPIGELQLKVPRDRNGDFRSAILPAPHQRDIKESTDLLEALFFNSYSPNQIRRTLKQMNLHYNPKELEILKNEYLDLFNKYQERQLTDDYMAVFIDVYHSKTCINNKVLESALYVAIGIDFEGKKDLLGLYLYEGGENKAFWLQTFNQLIERGLKRPMMIVSDDFSGLKQAISMLFPNALHQLCFIHMQRNVYRNMGRTDAKNFNYELKQIRLKNDIDICKNSFKELCASYQKKYPFFIKALIDDTDNYFAFKYFPQDVQKHFYTTNIVESVNSIIERSRTRMGGFFQSKQALFLNAFLSIESIKKRHWSHGVPQIKAHLYDLRQLFIKLYGQPPNIN